MNGIRLRAATLSDAAALGAVHVASWQETYAGILPDAMLASLTVEIRTAMWSEVLGGGPASGGPSVLVAEDEGRLAGFGSYAAQRDEALAERGFTGEIGAIYVLRSHQHLGLGRSMMSHMAQALSEQGHAGVTLWVLRENTAALRFYESLAGAVVGARQDEWRGATLNEVAYGWPVLSRLVG